MLIEINDRQYRELNTISSMLNKSVLDIIEDVVEKEIQRYKNNGVLHDNVKAKFWCNKIECDLAEKAGKEVEKVITDVYVLGKHCIYNEPYYRIIYQDRIVSVPSKNIEFYNEGDSLKI